MALEHSQPRPAGYAFLIEKYRLNVVPNWHTSKVSQTGAIRSAVQNGQVETVYPQSYWPGDRSGDHLEFALKYDGINLGILAGLFKTTPTAELIEWIAATPTGKYTRRIWFFFEYLTGQALPLPDLSSGNYIDALERNLYYTIAPGRRVQRQRIIDNLLGNPSFCPIIRRTDKLNAMDGIDLRQRCDRVVAAYPPELLKRALSYFYRKETKSSFEIEHITPSASRAEKFIGLLEMAEHKDFCEKPLLIDVQNRIVDPRFRDSDYRTSQNYIGQAISYQKQLIHYVCPKPKDLPALMEGLISSHHTMKKSEVPALVHAAAISYGFVYLHPFEDGNGRIHRFLIHNILAIRGATPKGLMFPVSAAMLKNPALYDQSLEAFSTPLMRLIEYELDDHGHMSVQGETGDWYRFIDMTSQAEGLSDFMELTIAHELVEELEFLACYDATKVAIQQIVDMPDRLIDLFIKACLQNNGRISATKRSSSFDFLTDSELTRMEQAVQAGYKKV